MLIILQSCQPSKRLDSSICWRWQ